MVLAYQLLFIILVIGSSFFGLNVFFMTLICSLIFTISNVFTLPLLMLQSTVILGTGVIGFVIATVVSLSKSGEKMSEYKRRMDFKSIISAIFYVILTFIGLLVYRSIYMYIHYVYSGGLCDLLKYISDIPMLYFIFIVPNKICKKFKIESNGFGCVLIGIAMIFMLRSIGLPFV